MTADRILSKLSNIFRTDRRGSVAVIRSAWHAAIQGSVPCLDQTCYIKLKTWLSTLEIVYLCVFWRRQ